MKLLNYVNVHPNWRAELAREPYRLDITNDGDYWMLSYNQLMSDMRLELVQEARGCILRQEGSQWIVVCYPFKKFFNWGEMYSAVHDIDWNTAQVQQKVDGSLIKMWWDRDEWHISTNGTIDAANAQCGDTTYKNLVMSVIGDKDTFFAHLQPDFTYMFELTTPFNRIVVNYGESKLWYLGRRNNKTEEEDNERLEIAGLWYPALFPHHSLSECVEAAHQMGSDEEGYVVVDGSFNRIKVKGDEYLALHRLRGNGPLTIARVLQLWKDNSLDDYLAYFSEDRKYVENVMNIVKKLIEECDYVWTSITNNNDWDSRGAFSRLVMGYEPIIRAFLFARLDNKIENAQEFIEQMRLKSLTTYVQRKIV